ncbi:MAG: hypothetical protein LC794_07120 [Acidobacteria bacterium]|nr:hypothetical protein [Acidobacteriota bacterium]
MREKVHHAWLQGRENREKQDENVNGDYLDTRTQNTPAELAVYDEHLNRLLKGSLGTFFVISD